MGQNVKVNAGNAKRTGVDTWQYASTLSMGVEVTLTRSL
jgi:hypothetical protein